MSTCPFCTKPVPDEASVCPHCLRAQPASTGPARKKSSSGTLGFMRGRWRPLILVLGLGAAWAYYLRLHPTGEYTPEPVMAAAAPAGAPVVVQTTIAPPLEVAIADSAATRVEGGRYLAFPFSGDGRAGCRVRGEVRALSGGDRRVSVFVVDRDGVAELEAGRTPRTYYDSGPVGDVSLDFNVDGRTSYTLVVSNPGARARTKTVRLRAVTASCAD